MPSHHIALISRNAELTDEVRRLCAIAGQQVRAAVCGPELERICRDAALVVIDEDAVGSLDESLADRCDEVVVVTRDPSRIEPWRAAVQVGARSVLRLPADAPRLLELLALSAEQPGPAGPVLGVVGGRGGAGASTVAVALGWSLARRGLAVTLADFDGLGGGLDVSLGLEHSEGLRWPDLATARGVVPSAELRERLPRIGELSVLSAPGPRAETEDAPSDVADPLAARAVIDAASRSGGAVVADLPRWPSDTTDAVMTTCRKLVLVVPADVRGVTAAVGVLRRLRRHCDDVRLVVRVDARTRLRARDVTAALGCDAIATIRTDQAVTAAADRGELMLWLRRARLGRTATLMADVLVSES